MRFPQLSKSFRARITTSLLLLCLIASILAGAADSKWS